MDQKQGASHAYSYDPAGNVASRTVGAVTTSFGYDPLDRLTDVSGPTSIHYGYDAVGNRTSQLDSSGTTTSNYDAADQLQTVTNTGGTTNYGFDANGNETTAGAWTYAFNLASRLTSATNGSTAADYTYDGDGNRLSATTGSATTNYEWDPNFELPQLALENDSSGSFLRRYTYGDGRISMTTPTTTAYYSSDSVGSVTELSGAAGALLGQYDQQPFGDNPTSSNVDPSVADNPFHFAGEYQDSATGLYDLRARNYDTTNGGFLSPDPLGPQNGANTYAYVANNPLSYTDPSGMKRTPSCGVGFWCWATSPEGQNALACGAFGGGAVAAITVEVPAALGAVATANLAGAAWGASLVDSFSGIGAPASAITGGAIFGCTPSDLWSRLTHPFRPVYP